MPEKITTCQLCKKYGSTVPGHNEYETDCENAFEDPVFGEHGFDFDCFEQDYFSPDKLKVRTGVEWRDNWAVYFRVGQGDWQCGTLKEAKQIVAKDIICALQPGPPIE